MSPRPCRTWWSRTTTETPCRSSPTIRAMWGRSPSTRVSVPGLALWNERGGDSSARTRSKPSSSTWPSRATRLDEGADRLGQVAEAGIDAGVEVGVVVSGRQSLRGERDDDRAVARDLPVELVRNRVVEWNVARLPEGGLLPTIAMPARYRSQMSIETSVCGLREVFWIVTATSKMSPTVTRNGASIVNTMCSGLLNAREMNSPPPIQVTTIRAPAITRDRTRVCRPDTV